MDGRVVEVQKARKSYLDGKDKHIVLDGFDFGVFEGESVALTGASGSGKSTLLNIIAGFEPLSSGELILFGQHTDRWKDPQWSNFRHQKLGVIFQQFNLLTPLNVKQNITFPLHLNNQKWDDWCDHLVEALGITRLLERHVASLSGGQQQRVAIARALAHRPQLLLADEPTGNLDQKAGLEVMGLLSHLAQQGNTAVVLVTHSQECAEFMQTQYKLENGVLINQAVSRSGNNSGISYAAK